MLYFLNKTNVSLCPCIPYSSPSLPCPFWWQLSDGFHLLRPFSPLLLLTQVTANRNDPSMGPRTSKWPTVFLHVSAALGPTGCHPSLEIPRAWFAQGFTLLAFFSQVFTDSPLAGSSLSSYSQSIDSSFWFLCLVARWLYHVLWFYRIFMRIWKMWI